jgi:adenylate cyclase class 2
MQEIEVKILEIDKDSLIAKLKSLGAKKDSEGNMRYILFDFADRRLKRSGKLLRLRSNGKDVELTFKGNISRKKAKIAEEHEVQVDDFDTAMKILSSIGLTRTKTYFKHRISYVLGKVRFEIDTLPGIPTFLEIEAPSTALIEKFVAKLGFSMKDAKPWTGKDVMRHYKK